MGAVLCVSCGQPIASGDYCIPGDGGTRHLKCVPSLSVSAAAARALAALRATAATTCPYGAGPDETCDTVPQPFVLPDVCEVCDARRALREIRASW